MDCLLCDSPDGMVQVFSVPAVPKRGILPEHQQTGTELRLCINCGSGNVFKSNLIPQLVDAQKRRKARKPLTHGAWQEAHNAACKAGDGDTVAWLEANRPIG